MALVVKDRVKVSSTSTGTGPITLSAADSGFQGFSVIGDGNQTYYAIVGPAEWETGVGTYDAGSGTLTRDTVFESTNAGALVNFSVGVKAVFAGYPAAASVDKTTPQTISNKTLADPAITLNGSQGVAGQALLSQGAGQPPEWGEAGVSRTEVRDTSFAYALIVGG